MSFFNSIPLPILVLLGFAVLGFCDYLKKLYTWGTKIEVFRDYRGSLVAFHNNAVKNNNIDHELSDYLLENALRINLDSIITIRQNYPMLGTSTGIMDIINDIVTLKCYDFTGTCRDFQNMLTSNIGFFENTSQEIRSKIINPIHLVKNGISFIFNSLPIVKLIPTKIKRFLTTLVAGIYIVETLLSLLSHKSLIEQIIEWISELPIF